VRKWPGSRAEFDDSKKPQVWHLIRPASVTVNNNAECGVRNKWHLIKPSLETVKNPDPDSFRPQGQRSRTQNPKGEEVVDLELGLFTWTACTGMKVSDFCVLAVPGTRTEWSEIKDRADRAAVATPVRLHSRGRSVWRWRYRKGNLNPRIATTDAPAKTRSRFPGAGPRPCPE